MKKRHLLTIKTDSSGNVLLPVGFARRYGFTGGARVRLEEDETGFRLSHPADALKRVYIEPTDLCNLDCVTCMRNVWDEPSGRMSMNTFEHILEGLRDVQPTPDVFFGGFGEPLSHPHIVEMIVQAAQMGASVELITNGTLLRPALIDGLIQAGLKRLWVSLDGATPEHYADVRLGAALPQVLEGLRYLKERRQLQGLSLPRLGIVFVAMKRNIADLPDLLRLSMELGADRLMVTNVLPYTPAMREEMLYRHSLYFSEASASEYAPQIDLPRMDLTPTVSKSLLPLLQQGLSVTLARQPLNQGMNSCPFVEKPSLSVRWDGMVAPCLALLHSHHSYLDDRARRVQAVSYGNVREQPLLEIWNAPAYRQLRRRLLVFDFAPCTVCNSCEMADSNQEDCYGNDAPTCGGCLWAQGFIQCP